jgi:hypothetical protein
VQYSRTNWRIGTPITQDKMNNIEEGIANLVAESNGKADKSYVD